MAAARRVNLAWPLPIAASLLAGTAGIVYFAYAAARWATLKSSALDLAYFDQVVWNASGGRGFTSSFAPYPFFGQHFSPALAIFIPLYAVHPSALWLLGAQSLALGAAIVPLFMLARLWLGDTSALIACTAYTCQLFVLRAVDYDFHTEALAVPFVFWAILGAVRASRRGDLTLLLAGIAPMLCKEDGALVSLGIGFLAWAVFKRAAGAILMAGALAYGLIVTVVVMPAIRGGLPGDLIDRYRYLGSSVPGVLAGLAVHPLAAVSHLLSPGPLLAVALLLGGVAFFPLARPAALLAAVPALLLALLSQKADQQSLLDQYGLQAGPLVFVAALLGWSRVQPLIDPASAVRWLRAGLVAGTAAALAFGAPGIGLGSLTSAQDAQSLAGMIPPGASVSASDGLLPLLAERPSIGIVPDVMYEWVAVDGSASGSAVLAELPGDGYVLAGSWGALSLWHRTA